MSRSALRCFLLAASLSVAAGAQAAEPTPAQIERLTDLVVSAMPFGKVFEMVSAKDPTWPLGDKSSRATPEQLACLRSELSVAGYRRGKHKQVVEYAKAHPERVADDIRLLDSGAAELFGKLVIAGAESEASGKPFDPESVTSQASAAAGVALTAVATQPGNADLRELIGMGGMFDGIETAADHEMEAKGEERGTQIGTQLMIDAMDTCKLPMSALQ